VGSLRPQIGVIWILRCGRPERLEISAPMANVDGPSWCDLVTFAELESEQERRRQPPA
jgi:hypothetical protein